MNAEFQRIARREKKAFLSDQCTEIEENNRMGKTRDHIKKTRDTKGTFHAKMGSIKDRNGRDLTEAEDIKKRWQEYTGELYKKDLHDQIMMMVIIMITHLEPHILECEVKWALGCITTNKASGGDGIPLELFQILKDAAVSCNMPANLGNSAVATGLEKVSFYSNPKECSNYHTVALISHASRRRRWHPTPGLLPGKSHGRRSLLGYSPWGY